MKTMMNKDIRSIAHRSWFLGASLLLIAVAQHRVLAYEDYTDCKACHGDFRGSTSTKGTKFPGNKNHDMHRNSAYMATACDLCHIGSSRLPVKIGTSTGTANNPGLGCTGCHVAEGLRAHHAANGVSECADCHTDGPSPSENVKPPYYGTPDTKANNPGNSVLATNINENWSVGDFLGLDNDGNNLYDLADYAVGPFQVLSVTREGNNLRVTWRTAGGRTDKVQTATGLGAAYAEVGVPVITPGVGLVTTSYVDVGGATNVMRFYRLKAVMP